MSRGASCRAPRGNKIRCFVVFGMNYHRGVSLYQNENEKQNEKDLKNSKWQRYLGWLECYLPEDLRAIYWVGMGHLTVSRWYEYFLVRFTLSIMPLVYQYRI